MSDRPMIIAINAVSGGGKTTVTRELQRSIKNSRALYFDNYDYDTGSGIEDICKWVEDGADCDLWNLQTLADKIRLLSDERPDYIFLDYPFGYRQKQIAGLIDYSIYIDTPLDIALARRVLRDYACEPAESVISDMEGYLSRGRKAYVYAQNVSKADSDLIVDGRQPVSRIVEIITMKIEERRAEAGLLPKILTPLK